MARAAVVGIGAVCTLALGAAATAAVVPDTFTQTCSDKLQNETLKYVNALQKQVRLSIKNNLKGKSSKCSGGFACSGGAAHGLSCTDNSVCGAGQCAVDVAKKGIGGKVNKAKAKLRAKFAQFCTNAQLATLGFPNSRCPDATTPDTVADCVLEGAIGDIPAAVFGDPAGEILGRAATTLVPQSTDPLSVCGVTLGSVLAIGSESESATVAEAGGAQPLSIDSCIGASCTTSGFGILGNYLTAPTQTFAGAIPICLVTVTSDAGNGTPQAGNIDLATGEQSSFAPILTTVLIGTTCPICDSPTFLCDSGANAGGPCGNAGATDTACPPTMGGGLPVIPNPLDLNTEANALSVPSFNPAGGTTNPAATFCGACDLDETVGCNNDSVCVANGACSGGVGSGCCVFGTNTGAFGDDNATTASANGVRGPYVPRLATIFCTGKSGSAIVDSTQGLPGPVRLVQQQLNAFEY